MGIIHRHRKDQDAERQAELAAQRAAQDPMEEDDEISDSDSEKQVKKSRRPKENAFTQQRLKAIHPILTPKNVIPALIVLAIIFIPLGVGMLYGANRVEDFVIDYSQCEKAATSEYYTEIPSEYYTWHFHSPVTVKPQWKLASNDSSVWNNYPEDKNICQIQFQIPDDIGPAVYVYYRLMNFYPNHRRFATSFSEDQIRGKQASVSDIKDTVGQNCQPLSVDDKTGKIIYPCGLIANSLFNDTYSSFSGVNGTSDDYKLTKDGTAWKYDAQRFKKTTYDPDTIVPPPNWVKMFPNGYTKENLPDISAWPEFQNWMAPAALSPFSKMALRNDDDSLKKGTYQISIGLHFPVLPYKGHKYLYVSTRSVIGGRNPFLGISWLVGGCICVVLTLFFVIIQVVHPRKLGDPSLLSWNIQKEEEDAKMEAKEEAHAAKESSSTSSR